MIRTSLRAGVLWVGLVTLAVPVWAQDAGSAGSAADVIMWIAITQGFAMAIASGLCGLAQAKAAAAACEGMARNPGAAGAVRFALILSLVLIESLALYTFAVVFFKITPRP